MGIALGSSTYARTVANIYTKYGSGVCCILVFLVFAFNEKFLEVAGLVGSIETGLQLRV